MGLAQFSESVLLLSSWPSTTVVTTGRTDHTRGQMAGVVASKVRKKRLKEVLGEDDQEKGVKLTVRNSVI